MQDVDVQSADGVAAATADMISSLGKLSNSSENSAANHNGEANHQDSNDSAVHSDYDDSASDENAKTNAGPPPKTDKDAVAAKATTNGAVAAPSAEKEQELIVIQENLFNVKINAPGVDLFDVQVST